jgi:hypothetical protein
MPCHSRERGNPGELQAIKKAGVNLEQLTIEVELKHCNYGEY